MTTREGSATPGETEDFIEHLFTASTHDYLMFFTDTGRVYVERVHEIPDMGRAAKGRSIANLLELKAEEKSPPSSAFCPNPAPTRRTSPGRSRGSFLATKKGTVKKTSLNEFGTSAKAASSPSPSREATPLSTPSSPAAALLKTTKSKTRRRRGADPARRHEHSFLRVDVRSMGRSAGRRSRHQPGSSRCSGGFGGGGIGCDVARRRRKRHWQAHCFRRVPPAVPRWARASSR